ncbi:tRNA modification GTPase GTPBP3, mitochondrial-like [Ptychodera flava]|uniref:tRNA modification GTPase GTPBP3, mitochondrial-like n=1 Tax=Ptychodera flava TaxID=63121 RepID=UPI00396A318A
MLIGLFTTCRRTLAKMTGFNHHMKREHIRLCKQHVYLAARTFQNASFETIYSLSSGHGKCGVAVVRVSGHRIKDTIRRLTNLEEIPSPRKASYQRFYDPVSREQIDKGLLLWFPGPNSFTGEDVCEFQVHGGPAIINALYTALDRLPGLRPAEAGEFTKRAFQNGKLDLTEVEGLSDLIHAETEAQRKQALRQMQGELGTLYNDWRQRLIKCAASVEAYIDFSEDDNIEDGVLEDASKMVKSLMIEIEEHLSDNRRGERLRSGVHVTIAGPPNAGKSSLLNAICQRPAAIVSPIAGTTRDVVETAVNISGYPVLLSDTAGLRETKDVIEQEGVQRALQRAQQADITILVLDVMDVNTGTVMEHIMETLGRLRQGQREMISETQNSSMNNVLSTESDWTKDTIVVLNKIDSLADKEQEGILWDETAKMRNLCLISCLNGDNFDIFLELLQDRVKAMCGNPSIGNPSLTQTRHRNHLNKCLEALESFHEHQDLVIVAEHLRIAMLQIGKITGKVGAEEILDVLFQDFCIGK